MNQADGVRDDFSPVEEELMKQHSRPRFRRTILSILLLIVSLGLLTIILIARQQAISLVTDVRHPVTQQPDAFSFESWDTVRFPSSDGLELSATFIPPLPEGNSTTIIFVHGLGGNRGNLLRQAEMLYPHGYGALLLDLRGHGDSDGTFTTFGYAEVADIQGAVDYLATRPEAGADRIGIVGASLGGAVVIRATARIPEIDVMVAESTYTSIEDNIADGVHGLTGLPPFPFADLVVFFGAQHTGVDIEAVRPVDDIGLIAPRPVMITHGTEDLLIPFRNGQTLFEAAGTPKEMVVIEGAGHGDFVDVDPIRFEQEMVEFFTTYLPAR
jgi:pimeloyl-ACP methyl ester carboxylesterase